jgi:uncharacterized protein with NAD-binding domain and iron-sulfur cluster
MTQPSTSGKKKVAVLGCGMGSIAAMYSLTQRPEDRDKYEITAYQMGWRVGGKGASGRNMDVGARIEEHGLHIWFGFYANAFKVMADAYKELGRDPSMPLATIESAFTPHDFIVLMDDYKNEWRSPWQYSFPADSKKPWLDDDDLPSLYCLLAYAVTGLTQMLEAGLFGKKARCSDSDPTAHDHPKGGWWERIKEFCEAVDQKIHEAEIVPATALLGVLACALQSIDKKKGSLIDEALVEVDKGLIDLLTKIRTWLWDAYGCHVDDDTARECLVLGDATLTGAIGMIQDRVYMNGIFSIDDVELSDWLTKHGSHPITLTSPLVRALYDNIFAYENGDVSKPNAAAGTSLLWVLRMILTYKGHIMWKMNAGMGDTIFTPFYQVLQKRGVTFNFFNCVTNLGLNATKDAIETIDVMQQVDLTVDAYNPLVDVKNLPCWPNQPNWEQIKDGEQFRAQGVNLEQVVTPYAGRQPKTLRVGEDFDIVVLGIPVAVLPTITQELYDNSAKPAWKTMVDNIATVQTQAYQLWINQPLQNLGWIAGDKSPVLGTYVELIDTYADMSQLLPVEDPPASDNVQNIAYFCGAMPDTATQAEADALAYKNSLDNLTSAMPALWRNLKNANGDINWDLLVDATNANGEDRFKAQFVRSNWTGTERYTLSVAGSTKYRLKADESGYSNLFLAGDWTQNDFNSGCIEASTMSGMQASRAICGYPERIVGEPPDIWEGAR